MTYLALANIFIDVLIKPKKIYNAKGRQKMRRHPNINMSIRPMMIEAARADL